MTAEDARQALDQALRRESPGLSNFVIRGDSLEDGQASRFSLTEDMAATVTADVRKVATSLLTKQFLTYDPSYRTNSSQVLIEELAEIPELARVVRQLRSGDVRVDSGGEVAVALAHVIGVSGEQVVAMRMKGPGIATRRTKAITLVPRDGIYEPVDDDVLYYEPRFDVFAHGDFAYFTSVTLIQTKLLADGKARQLARETLVRVTADVSIEGFEQLQEAVMDDANLRAKMAAVARLVENDPDYAAHLTTERLVAFVRANPDFKIPISEIDGEEVLRFDTSPQHRHQIPRLLADDYLHSQLTERNYEAGSKQRVTA